jgi:hypothetical protein
MAGTALAVSLCLWQFVTKAKSDCNLLLQETAIASAGQNPLCVT